MNLIALFYCPKKTPFARPVHGIAEAKRIAATDPAHPTIIEIGDKKSLIARYELKNIKNGITKQIWIKVK
jgi:hypothetical protein